MTTEDQSQTDDGAAPLQQPGFSDSLTPPAIVLQYATARVYQDQSVWRERNLLVMKKGAALPATCVKCGGADDVRPWRKTLYWHHPAFYILALLYLIVYAIVALIVRKSVKVEAGLCATHRSKRRRTFGVAWLLALASIAAFIGGLIVSTPRNDLASSFLVVGGLLGILAAVLVAMFGSRVLWARRIDNHFAWLAGACPAYLDQFPTTGN